MVLDVADVHVAVITHDNRTNEMPWRKWTRSIVACDPCETPVQCFGLVPDLHVYEEGHGTPVRIAGIQVHRPLRLLDPPPPACDLAHSVLRLYLVTPALPRSLV